MPSGRMRSVDAGRFAMVPRNDVPRSAFDSSHGHKTTMSAGNLIPIFVDEVLPGDSLRLRMLAYARQATSIVPTMDNLTFESFFFFVPCRLLWDNWQRFMGERTSPTDTTEFLTPIVSPTQLQASTAGSIWDYLGVWINGVDPTAVINVQAMPLRAYALIWNEFFRDQDLMVIAPFTTGDGPDTAANYGILARTKRHDYFTSARPWPQKPINQTTTWGLDGAFAPGAGFAMTLPNQGAAPVSGLGVGVAATTSAGPLSARESGSRTRDYAPYYTTAATAFNMDAVSTDGYPDVKVLVNDIRTAVMIQSFLEKNSRGGTRYAELVRSHFGVVSPDARLQRPEYLGGGRQLITMQSIQQTAPQASSSTNLGDSGGLGSLAVYDHGFSQSFTEHGFILGLVTIRADLTYQQGVERFWFRRTVFDHYWPSLAHLGEQAILRREIFANGVVLEDNTVFGYQERWSEYKYKPSRISGFFRSMISGTLDVWHFAEEFGTAPVLNNTFIVDPSQAVVARTVLQEGAYEQQFMVDTMFELRRVRAMPMYSIPGFGPRL